MMARQQPKATRRQLKRHNRRLILSHIYDSETISRAQLATVTGLSKPTVSDIVNDLIDLGLVVEGGLGHSSESGGKPPRLLYFVPESRQIIGISLFQEEIVGVLANLNASLLASHQIPISQTDPEIVIPLIEKAIYALMAQSDAKIACISIGIPGIIDEKGDVLRSPAFGWEKVSIINALKKTFDVPIYISNITELVIRAQVAFGEWQDDNHRYLATVSIGETVEVGTAFDGSVFQYGLDLSHIPLACEPAILNWKQLLQRYEAIKDHYPHSPLHKQPLRYLYIRSALKYKDDLAEILVNEISQSLAHIFAWVIAVGRPDQITITGDIIDLGDILTERTSRYLDAILPQESLYVTSISRAASLELSLLGTIAKGLQQEIGVL
ncbi:hypothetical protein MASR2M15_02940 [Anaerolineales bacterium]